MLFCIKVYLSYRLLKNELGPCFCHLSLATETGEFLSLTREFIVYEGDTQIVRISTDQSCMPKYNVILFIRSSGSQMNSAHFNSTSAAMDIMTLL